MKTRRSIKRALVGSGVLSTCLLVPSGMVRLTPAAYAQATTATLGGIVTDATGASIPKAQIDVKNAATGDVRSSVSNDSGAFNFTALPVGDYVITIKATGFTPFAQTGIHLDPGDTRSVRDIKLSPGSTNQVVEVTTAANTINIDSGEQSSLISSEDIKHLSVEGRDVTELLKILPGFAISKGGAGNFSNTPYDPAQVSPQGALGQYAANGTPVNGQALLSDGVDITDPGAFGGALQNVNYEQVAEVKVQTSSFSADTAHGPIVINAISKSGGATYHGSLYTFARASQLNSTDWIAKYSGQSKPPDRYVYPGFTFGGPIQVPGTKFGASKKLTFFVGAEDYAQRNAYAYGDAAAATLTALVPTAGMRTGDFSQGQLQQYLGAAYGVTTDGSACTYNGSASGNIPNANICRVPVTGPQGQTLVNGNIAPYLDPFGKIALNQMPLPNTTSNGTYNWITTNLINNNLWQARGRVDYAASDKDKIFGSYSIEKGSSSVPQNEYYSARGNLGGINVPGGGLLSPVSSHVASLNYTHIFGPSLTNEFYVAGAYFAQSFVAKDQAAIANNPYKGVFDNGSTVQPTLEDYGNDGLPLLRTPDTSFGGIFAKKQVRIAGDNVSKVIGKHSFKAGVFYQYDSNPQIAPFVNTNGTIAQYYIGETFQDKVAGLVHSTGPVGSGNGGNYLADFAEGQIFQYSQSNIAPEPNLYFWNLAGYVQDHWRLASRFTVDVGVRFEHMTPWQDSHNQGVAVFRPADYDAGVNSALLPGVQWHGINSSIPNGGRPTRWGFVEPRAGFSWDVTGQGKTVVRGGFGIYRAHDAYNDASNQSGTVIGSRNVTVNGPLLLSSVSSFASQYSSATFVPDSNVYAFDPTDDETPRVRTYNLSVDQQMPGKMLLEISYVGNSSDKLLNDGSTQNTVLDDLNSLPVGALYGPQPKTGKLFPLFGPATPPSSNNYSIGSLDQATIDSFKRFPTYNRVFVPEHNTYSNYNGLQVGLVRQAGPARYNVNYTFSKALGIQGIGGSSTYSYPADPFNYANDYASMPFDRRHIFNASYSYDEGNIVKERYLGIVANGWEISGIFNYQSGPNLPSIINSNFGIQGNVTVPVGAVARVGNNVSTCTTTSGTGGCQIGVSSTNILGTPNVNLQNRIVGQVNQTTGSHQYINGSAFALPALGTNGDYRLPFLPGPGFFNADLTASKRFKITEGLSSQLRVAAFNVLNHANNTFTQVNQANYTLNYSQTSNATDVNTALLSANGGPSTNPQFGYAPLRIGRRIMELGLRFDF